MTPWRMRAGTLAALILWFPGGSTVWAQTEAPREIETLKRIIQDLIRKNQELKAPLRDPEEEVNTLKAVTGKPEPAAPESPKGSSEESSIVPTAVPTAEAATEPSTPERSSIVRDIVRKVLKDTPLRGKLELGGTIEVDVSWQRNFGGTTSSDIRLTTADFDLEVKPVEWAKGVLAVTWDQDTNSFTVDEAYAKLGNPDIFPLFVTAGRVIAPFGLATSNKVTDKMTLTDPLTFEIFETKEDVILLGLEAVGFRAGAYVFNPKVNRSGGNDHIEGYGGTLGYRTTIGDLSVDMGVDMINSVFDSTELSQAYPEALTAASYIPGIAAHATLELSGFSLVGEYNGALRHLEYTRDGTLFRRRPEAWQVELGYTTEILGRKTYAAIGYSRSYEVGGSFPRQRLLATVGRWLLDGLRLAVEYSYETDYAGPDGGTGDNGQGFIARLTFAF